MRLKTDRIHGCGSQGSPSLSLKWSSKKMSLLDDSEKGMPLRPEDPDIKPVGWSPSNLETTGNRVNAFGENMWSWLLPLA